MTRETAKLIDPKILAKEAQKTTIDNLAKKYKVNPTTIFRKLAKAGYKGKSGRRRIILNKQKLLKDLETYSILKLAPRYNVSLGTMYNFVKTYLPEYKIKRGRRKEK